MRIPTLIQYKSQLDSISSQSDELTLLQRKINSNKKLINSSDDPVLSQRIKSTQDYINQINAFQQNTTNAQNRFNLIESSIKRSLDSVARVRELIRGAQSDTASPTDRQNMVKELRGLLNNLNGYANTKDGSGDFIFSGTSTTTAPFSTVNGVFQYMGSQSSSQIEISETISQRYNESGQEVFGDIRLGNGSFTIHQGSTPNLGTAETGVGTVTNFSNYVEDDYTLTFVTNGDGQLAYQVIGANSGQVIPAAPATVPTDAVEYHSGDAIAFNGISFMVTGAPEVGDTFEIQPSQTQNALETIRQVTETIGMNITTNAEKANYHQELSQLSASVDQINNHLTNYLSDIGYRTATVETEVSWNQTVVEDQTMILSHLSDADLAALVPEANQKMLSLQITSESYIKLSQLFAELMRSSFG